MYLKLDSIDPIDIALLELKKNKLPLDVRRKTIIISIRKMENQVFHMNPRIKQIYLIKLLKI